MFPKIRSHLDMWDVEICQGLEVILFKAGVVDFNLEAILIIILPTVLIQTNLGKNEAIIGTGIQNRRRRKRRKRNRRKNRGKIPTTRAILSHFDRSIGRVHTKRRRRKNQRRRTLIASRRKSQSQSGGRKNRGSSLWRAAIPKTKGRNGGSRSPRKKRGPRKSLGQRKRKKS